MHDTSRFPVLKISEGQLQHTEDAVVVEEPLEIRVNTASVGITMRTPGDDFDLAVGLLRTEGIIKSAEEIGTMGYCPDEEHPDLRNIINITLLDQDRKLQSSRRLWVNSSCGICGQSTLEAIQKLASPIESGLKVDYDVLSNLPSRMRERQRNFDVTGGIHAAGLFDVSGKLVLIREDLGRHNAVDKVLGAGLRSGIRFSELIMMVSGRLGFEIAQKALVAGVPIIASVSAPSSLALNLANLFGITAVGFVRGHSMNVYTHPQRLQKRKKEPGARSQESGGEPLFPPPGS
jgi:FdhD protein